MNAAYDDHHFASVLVQLDAPRMGPEVLHADGLRVFDGRRLLRVVELPRMEDGGRTVFDIGVDDEASGETRVLPLGLPRSEFRIASLSGGDLAVERDGGVRWLDTATGERVAEAPPAWTPDRPGPGQGFHVRLQDGVVSLSLPHREGPIRLFHGVDHLVCVSWVVDAGRPARDAAALRFKGVRPIRLQGGGRARVDGRLGDWGRALPVDRSAFVQDGRQAWSGPRDAAFGVAARESVEGGTALAIRARDDHLMMERDRLELVVRGELFVIPAQPPGAVLQSPLRAIFARDVDHGFAVEVSLPRLGAGPGDELPIVVRYVDRDPGEAIATVLANAPSISSLAAAPQSTGALSPL